MTTAEGGEIVFSYSKYILMRIVYFFWKVVSIFLYCWRSVYRRKDLLITHYTFCGFSVDWHNIAENRLQRADLLEMGSPLGQELFLVYDH